MFLITVLLLVTEQIERVLFGKLIRVTTSEYRLTLGSKMGQLITIGLCGST